MQLEQMWCGASKTDYDFIVHSSDSSLPLWGGVYMLCSQTESGWQVHYIGESDDFSSALNPLSSKGWLYASSQGATHVHIYLQCNLLKRKRVVRDLVTSLHPTFENRQRGHGVQIEQVA